MRELTSLPARWLVLMLMFVPLCLSIPRHAGPDEPAHVVRSAGIVRGDAFGDPSELGPAYRQFDVDGWAMLPDPSCFAFQPGRPAGCSTAGAAEYGPNSVSSAASYPVFAHVVPGVATLLPGGARTLWIARLLAASVNAALLAFAFAAMTRWHRGGLTSATLVALTPAAVFSMVVVNPTGLTVAGAICAVVGTVGLHERRDGAAPLFVAGATALVVPRPDGLVWAALAIAVTAVAIGASPSGLWERLARWHRAVLIGVAVQAVVWSAVVRPELVEVPTSRRGLDLVAAALDRTSQHLNEAIGLFGWLDTAVPSYVLVAWWACVGLVAGGALQAGGTRVAATAGLAFAGFVAAGWVADVVSGPSVGLVWQGRYGLPLLIAGVMVLGMGSERLGTRLGAVVAVGAVGIGTLSFAQALRRWSVGDSGALFPWEWQRGASLLHPALALVVFAVGLGLLALPSIRVSDVDAVRGDAAESQRPD